MNLYIVTAMAALGIGGGLAEPKLGDINVEDGRVFVWARPAAEICDLSEFVEASTIMRSYVRPIGDEANSAEWEAAQIAAIKRWVAALAPCEAYVESLRPETTP